MALYFVELNRENLLIFLSLEASVLSLSDDRRRRVTTCALLEFLSTNLGNFLELLVDLYVMPIISMSSSSCDRFGLSSSITLLDSVRFVAGLINSIASPSCDEYFLSSVERPSNSLTSPATSAISCALTSSTFTFSWKGFVVPFSADKSFPIDLHAFTSVLSDLSSFVSIRFLFLPLSSAFYR